MRLGSLRSCCSKLLLLLLELLLQQLLFLLLLKLLSRFNDADQLLAGRSERNCMHKEVKSKGGRTFRKSKLSTENSWVLSFQGL